MRREHDVFKGAVAGALAGLAASYVMEQFQAWWSEQEAQKSEAGSSDDASDPSTVKAADKVSMAVTGHPVPPALRDSAGDAVHYTTGAGVGAVYGALAEIAPGTTFGFGAAYGAAVALGLDETIVPALGLGKGPGETPPSEHAYGLASHLVYGLALEGSRRIVRAIL
ncbi:MAG: DUF1440 domain-containing protein [Pseudomonadota bacterium]|nr:DUF1440 domain-containing protein [Pseudomonadota bacterium]